MEFKQLEVFMAVVRCGSFSRAAESLYLTQPTVSAHVGALEKELGTRLIDRGARQARPTPVGEVLYDHAAELLAMREKTLAACRKQGAQLSGVIHMAASTVAYQYILPSSMAAFRRAYSQVTFNIRESDSGTVAREIAAGHAEIGMTGAMMDSSKCRFQPFMEDELVAVTPNAPPFDTMAQPHMTAQAIAAHPIILRESGSGTRHETETWLSAQGVDPGTLKVAAVMEGPDAIKNAVSQGLGLSIISRLAINDYQQLGRVRVFQLAGLPARRKLYLVSHRQRILSPQAAAFLSFVQQQYSKG